MSGAGLLVLADDLTGACECALAAVEAGGRALASLGEPVAGDWDLVAVDLAARDEALDPSRAVGGDREPVLKIDSTLRGPVRELIAWFAGATAADLVVVAPALPARGRVTRRGVQRLVGAGEAPVDLRALIGRDGHETVILDAEHDADLDAGVAWADATGRRIAWVGSAGLVAALVRARHVHGPRVPAAPAATGGPVLAVVGSGTAETARQVAALAARADVDVHAPEAGDAAIARTLAAGRHALLRGDRPGALAAVACAADAHVPLRRLLLTGGATARAVCTALGVSALEIAGAAAEGTPVGRGGERWIATKAGRFGAPDALSVALDRLARWPS